MAKRKRKTFTPEFKAEVVLETLSGESWQAELCRRHNLSEEQLSKWRQQVVENVASLLVPQKAGLCVHLKAAQKSRLIQEKDYFRINIFRAAVKSPAVSI